MEVLKQIANAMVRWLSATAKSDHQEQVNAFMVGAKQSVPVEPGVPPEAVIKLRARLMFEETMETINEMGVTISLNLAGAQVYHDHGNEDDVLGSGWIDLNAPGSEFAEDDEPGVVIEHKFNVTNPCCLVGVVDGCCDVAVVTTGTLTAFGVSDILVQTEVNNNNLLKFAEGHRIDDGGKLIKPSHHPTPRLGEALEMQRPPE